MMTHPVQTSRHHLPESQLIQGSQLLWRMGIPMMKAMMMMMMMAIKAMVMLLPV